MRHSLRTVLAITALAGTALTLAACGGETDTPLAAPAPAPAAAAPAAPAATPGSTVAVKAATSPLGQILVDPTGRTLYAFTNDVAAESTCTGTCAEAWPPVVVDESWNVAPGLDSGVFSTVTRSDGSLQLTAGKFPLYYFSGDAKPGDLNGQGSGDVWFVVADDATLVRDAAGEASTPTTTPAGTKAPAPAPAVEPTVALADTDLGRILVDAEGRTLYGFTKDVDGTSTCAGGCATAWPPLLVEGDAADLVAGEGLAGDAFTVIERADGTRQLKLGKWPLYTFSGDEAPGQTNGQGSGGSWFVVAADGKLVKG